jgi:hypothetical protein
MSIATTMQQFDTKIYQMCTHSNIIFLHGTWIILKGKILYKGSILKHPGRIRDGVLLSRKQDACAHM